MWSTSLHTHMSKAINTWQNGASVFDVTFRDRHGLSPKNLFQEKEVRYMGGHAEKSMPELSQGIDRWLGSMRFISLQDCGLQSPVS